jgi:amidase
MKGLGVELIGQGARAQAGMIARGEVSPVEVMRETLARIAELNGKVNAIVSLRDRERLMGEARLMEAELRGGGPRGWLHGCRSRSRTSST